MKQNRSKTKTVVRVIAFLLVAALLYGALSRLLAVNDATEQQYIHSFYLEPKKLARCHDPRRERDVHGLLRAAGVAARGLYELSAGRVGRTGDHVPLHAA